MREIIRVEGKFYVQEIFTSDEITVDGLNDQLASVKAAKDAALTAKGALYDTVIAQIESDLEAIQSILDKKKPKKPKKS